MLQLCLFMQEDTVSFVPFREILFGNKCLMIGKIPIMSELLGIKIIL